MWHIGLLDVPKRIAGETTMKMMHKEVGICRRYVCHKESVFREKFRCDALDTYINKMYVPYEKTTRESNVLILNRLYLSDISCGTWEAIQKCDKSDNGLDTGWLPKFG